MIKIISRIVFITALILITVTAFSAQTKKAKKISYGERLITALINSKTLPGNFGDDGVFFEGTGTDGELSPDVIRILDLGEKAIPLLTRHLDDRRVFKHLTFCCAYAAVRSPKVTVGEVALDILTVIVRRDKPMFDFECLKILGSGNIESRCVEEKFYEGKTGKRNWLKAYRAGKIHYEKYDY